MTYTLHTCMHSPRSCAEAKNVLAADTTSDLSFYVRLRLGQSEVGWHLLPWHVEASLQPLTRPLFWHARTAGQDRYLCAQHRAQVLEGCAPASAIASNRRAAGEQARRERLPGQAPNAAKRI